MKSFGEFNWQQVGWPKASCNRALLREELRAFETAFRSLKKTLRKPQDLEVVARALTDEAVTTSAIEGVAVDESVVMSSICKALGVAYAPKGFTKDARAEGVAQMMLALREKWNAPLSAKLLTGFHGALMKGEESRVAVGAFRSHKEPMRVIRRHADGTVEIRYEAPPSDRVPKEIAAFVKLWKATPTKPADIALKAAMLHPHFESIHPFEDGEAGVRAGLSAARWMRMAKVSKATATRDIEELESSGAIVAEVGGGPASRYRLNSPICEPIDPLNDALNVSLEGLVLKTVARHPGVRLPFLASVASSLSKVTVKRAVAALVKAGKIEHRGSKKTGGYWVVGVPGMETER